MNTKLSGRMSSKLATTLELCEGVEMFSKASKPLILLRNHHLHFVFNHCKMIRCICVRVFNVS